MEIPGNEFRIKNKAIQEKIDVSSKKGSAGKVNPAPAGVSGGEQIALSSKARGIQKALETVKSSPDIRAEKVNRIKSQIADGTFHVDSEVLAEKILQEIITESRFLE